VSLAIFDLDHTLIATDSDHSWGEFMVEQGLVDASVYKAENDRFYADYERGELDIQAYNEFSLKPLTRFTMDELAELHAQFSREKIDPAMLPKAKALLAEHRANGDFLLIITSTNRFITQPIAESLGVDALLATDAEIIGNRYTGRMIGTPCFQEGKITRLAKWLKDDAKAQGFSGDGSDTYFYSDSINDLPLLKQSKHPVVVDPDETLRAAAESRNWPIMSLRD
jgi:HAD superfamily hydrolase (TIGR01490 family)